MLHATKKTLLNLEYGATKIAHFSVFQTFFSAHIYLSNWEVKPVQFAVKQVVKDKKCISKCYKSKIVVVTTFITKLTQLQIQTTKITEEN